MSSETESIPQEHMNAEDGQGGSDSQQDVTPPLTANKDDLSQSTESESSASKQMDKNKKNDGDLPTSSFRTENNMLAIEEAERNLQKQRIEEALTEVHLSWNDTTSAYIQISHRALKRYSEDLYSIVKVMRSYAYSKEDNEMAVITAVYEYISNGLSKYLNLLMYWLQNNEDSSARTIVEGLLKDYEDKLHSRLERYYEKAKIFPSDRSTASASTLKTNTSSQQTKSKKSEKTYDTLSHSSKQIVEQLRADYQEKVVDFNIEQRAILRAKEKAEQEADRLKKDLLETKNLAAQKEQELMEKAIEEKNKLLTEKATQRRKFAAWVEERERINSKLEQQLRSTRDHTALERKKLINQAQETSKRWKSKLRQKYENFKQLLRKFINGMKRK